MDSVPATAPIVTTAPRLSLVCPADVEREIGRLFDAGSDSGLVIRVHGEESAHTAGAIDAFRELIASLRMYDDRYRDGGERVLVEPPSSRAITRALSVLARPEHQKRILEHVLTTFGRRLIDPLADLLDPTPQGSLLPRLSVLRDIFLAQLRELRLTDEMSQIMAGDLRNLLSDEYLSMIAEHEERVQRPKVTALAQRILRLIGSTFHAALKRWPAHAEQIALSISRRMQGQVSLKESPLIIRDHIASGIEEFLWVETSVDIQGALDQLFAEYKNVLPAPIEPLDRSVYRRFAEACWGIIAEYC